MEDNSIPALGEDLAVTFLLPSKYHGVLFQPEPRLKLLSLKAAFMDPSFEPVASSDPPRATLAKWWKAVSERVRDSYELMPDELKEAMKGRMRLYLAPVGEAFDVVDLAAEAAIVDPAAEASDGDSSPAKRSRRSVSRPRVVATSSSSSTRHWYKPGCAIPAPVWYGWRSRFRYGAGRSEFRLGFCWCSRRVIGRGGGAF